MRSRTAVAAVATVCALATVLLSGCGLGGLADAPRAAAAGDVPAGPSAPTPKATATRSPVATSSPTSSPTSTPAGTAGGTPAASAGATASVAPSWPRALGEPSQGDPVWAVYLAVGHSVNDPALQQATAHAAAVGYRAVVGDVACDDGATQALGLDQYDYWSGATLYFATEKQARGFAAAYTAAAAAPVGLTQVNVGCLD
ncbi:hypothetical protein ACPPVT_09230 [Angustibacter sp. McL0619]|uniref:hypothetical protein n=1 Tax=Angustibacter sp. McL0619 TaxID=3415676 RepID=UPI003CF8BE92